MSFFFKFLFPNETNFVLNVNIDDERSLKTDRYIFFDRWA